jgi:hypothetical protein
MAYAFDIKQFVLKKLFSPGYQRLMPVILATQVAEIRKIMV